MAIQRRFWPIVVVPLIIGAAALAPTGSEATSTRPGVAVPLRPAPVVSTSPTTPPAPRTLTVVGSGDILLHSGLWRQAQRDAAAAGSTGYDFAPLFAGVRSVVAQADLAICHMETPVGNPGGPFTGFPIFSVPPQVVPALVTTGYDTCSTASNHSLDGGAAGIGRTLDAFDTAGIRHTGTARSEREWATPTILDVRGVPVGHLSYTFSFNGLIRPAAQPWLANALDATAILDEARRARAAGAEIVIVSIHWGTEYSQRANDEQVTIARTLLTSPDIDLILGHHAHVVQPMEKLGDKWVVYGMGNHVAWQPQRDTTRDGVLARMTFTETGPGRWRVTTAEALTTYMSLGDTARLVLVPATLADPATPAALRDACARSYARSVAAITARGAPDLLIPRG